MEKRGLSWKSEEGNWQDLVADGGREAEELSYS